MTNNKKEEFTIVSWAEREIQIACDNEKQLCDSEEDASYGIGCYHSALKALRSLADDGHSGFSIQITKNILNRLIDGLPLTPIEDTDDIWNVVSDNNEKSKITTYQCKRCSHLFKDVNDETGEVTYDDVHRVVGVDAISGYTYTSGLTTGIYNELFPITMPYMPPSKKAEIHTEEFLFDPVNGGDFDTEAVLYVITPDDNKVEINRFFKDAPSSDCESPAEFFHGWIEITEEEYNERKSAYEKRISNTNNNEEMENGKQ